MDLMEVKLNGKDLKQEAFRLCQDFLGSAWKRIDISDFKLSTVSGGLSNTLYCCSLPDNVVLENPKTPKKVLLRIYGPIQDEPHVVVIEATTFMLLSERQLGPKLYGLFPNGRLEEYIPSRSLGSDDIRQMSTTIARELAKIHALDVPVKKNTNFWTECMTKWLQEVENETRRKYNESFSLGDMFREETKWLTDEMEKTRSPIVYCHNDLQGGNILLRNDTSNDKEPKIILIDFEFGAYNYRGYDLANQFCEWIFDYNTPEPPYFKLDVSKYPSREEKVKYISAYLDQLILEGILNSSSFESELNNILKEVKLFGMASHLYWALWSEKMKFVSSLYFSHQEHGNTRRTLFKQLKEKYLKESSKFWNGNSDDRTRNE